MVPIYLSNYPFTRSTIMSHSYNCRYIRDKLGTHE